MSDNFIRLYLWGAALLFFVLGILGFFWPLLNFSIWQSIIHIVFGGLAAFLLFRSLEDRLLKWLTVISSVLAILAFAGVSEIWRIWNFSLFLKWFYFALALISIWVSLSRKPRSLV